MHELANLLENNSNQLQSATLTAEQAVYSIKKLYDQTKKIPDLRPDDETQQSKRKKSAPRHLSAYVAHSSLPSSATEMDNKAELSCLYYEAVDSVVEPLLRRFHQQDLETLEAAESCLLAAVTKMSPWKKSVQS